MAGNAPQYLSSHPWLTFKFDSRELPTPLWAHLGESYSKCQHLVGTPLQPSVALRLSEVYLRRGALSSAAIEGNTLNEQEVEDILVNNKKLPESQQYLEQEVRNVVDALTEVRVEVYDNPQFRLTKQWILDKHERLLRDLELEDHVTPGRYRTVPVVVGPYRGAPAQDVPELMDKLCEWVNEMIDSAQSEKAADQSFFYSFYAATLAHLYLAWIHPFGDGNGRLARLIECAILAHSHSVPWISTSVLSNHYNRTKSKYYQKLDAASRQLDVAGFIAYSITGFRDQLRLQVKDVQAVQRGVAWVNYVHEKFQGEPSTPTARRRRAVALAMPHDALVEKKSIKVLTTEIAAEYARTSDKLLARDLTKLCELELIDEMEAGVFESGIWRMDAFLPSPELGAFSRVVARQGKVEK
ncbi:MAG: Fic family protein [Rhodoglobus sp.]|nr:Fic family protein [Rhodoglobus sp.]